MKIHITVIIRTGKHVEWTHKKAENVVFRTGVRDAEWVCQQQALVSIGSLGHSLRVPQVPAVAGGVGSL